MTTTTATTKPRRTYCCALCGRRLPHERWVYSHYTGNRFCWPGECRKHRRRKSTTTEGGQA